ncbi:MAG: fructose-6-phosphate aldolase [Thermoplasmata archaeon]|jgi:transaldolase
MKIFLDTANIDEIKKAMEWGVLDGVTTNPTLVSKEANRGKFDEIIDEIIKTVPGPVSVEVFSTDFKGMVEEAEKIAEKGSNVVIKIPMGFEGLKAVNYLSKKGIKTNMTLIFTSNQALLAAKVGATYVSPFVGRLDDIGEYGMSIVENIKTIYSNYGFKTEIIVASVRHPIHVMEASLIGADVVTMPFSVLEKMVNHPKTDEGIVKFLEDAKKIKF